MRCYIDTSILACVYCDESQAKAAQKLLQSGEPVISSLTRLEFSSAVAKKLRMKTFTRTEAARIISQFHEHIRAGIFATAAVEESHYTLANEWVSSFSTGLCSMDALHLAIAASEECPLVTADVILAKSARQLGLKVITL